MPINYPSNLKHTNNDYPVLKADTTSVQGWVHVDTINDRDSLGSNKRITGAVVVVGTQPYIYTSANTDVLSWTDANNWSEVAVGEIPEVPDTIEDFSDIGYVASVVDGDVLRWNASASRWEPWSINYGNLPGSPTLAQVATTGEYPDLGKLPVFQAGTNMTITPVDNNGTTTFTFDAGGGGGSTTLGGLTDVDVTQLNTSDSGQILFYDSASGDWIPTQNGPTAGQNIEWDFANQKWIFVNNVIKNTSSVTDLSDVDSFANVFGAVGQLYFNDSLTSTLNLAPMAMTTSPTEGNFLSWDATNTTPVWASSVSMDLNPETDLAYTLGTSDFRWSDIHGDLDGAVTFRGTNTSGGTLNTGDVVVIDSTSTGEKPDIVLAQDGTSNFPAWGLVKESSPANSDVHVVTSGLLYNVSTTSWPVGTNLYVSTTAGDLTATPPATEANGIQKIAKVVRQHSTNGVLFVSGAGRANATPNLNTDKIFLGGAGNRAQETALSSIGLSKFNDDLNYDTSNISDIPNPSIISSGSSLKVNAAGSAYDLYAVPDYILSEPTRPNNNNGANYTLVMSDGAPDTWTWETWGTAASLNVPGVAGATASSTQVVRGDDPRFGGTFPNNNDDVEYVLVTTDAGSGVNTTAWVDKSTLGTTQFTGLSDTPANFTGAGEQVVRVNSGASGLEFHDLVITDLDVDQNTYLLNVSGQGLIWDNANSTWRPSASPLPVQEDINLESITANFPSYGGFSDTNAGNIFIPNSSFAGSFATPTLSTGQILVYNSNLPTASAPGWTQQDVMDSVATVIESPSVKTYKIVLKMPTAGIITEIVDTSTTDTVTYNVEMGGVNVFSSDVVTVAGTDTSRTSFASSIFAKDSLLEIDVSAIGSAPTDFCVTINYKTLYGV